MGQVEELEERRAKLEARLAEVKRQQRAVEQAAAARRSHVERKADAHRKIVLGGALLVLLRSNPQLREFLRRELPKAAAERDRPLLTTLLDGLGTPQSGHGAGRSAV